MKLIDADALKASVLNYDGYDINIWQVAEKVDAAPTVTNIPLSDLLRMLFNVAEGEETVYETCDENGNIVTDWHPDWIVRSIQPILRVEIEPPRGPTREE